MSLVQAETAGTRRAVDAVGVFLRHLDDFVEQAFLQRDRIKPEFEELLVADNQIVLGRFLARVRQPGDLRRRSWRIIFGQIAHPVGLGHLVEDLDLVAARRRIVRARSRCSAPNPGCG
jgi:hypothetical protein